MEDEISQDIWTAVNKLSRSQIESILEEHACIQCYDSETTDELRTALAVNIADGTIDLAALNELP